MDRAKHRSVSTPENNVLTSGASLDPCRAQRGATAHPFTQLSPLLRSSVLNPSVASVSSEPQPTNTPNASTCGVDGNRSKPRSDSSR
jgi:hypothetical protein